MLDVALCSGEPDDRPGQLEHGHLLRVAEVDRQLVALFERRQYASDEVGDVADAPGLGSIAVDGQSLATDCLSHEVGHGAAVGNLHPGTMRVEDPHDPGI